MDKSNEELENIHTKLIERTKLILSIHDDLNIEDVNKIFKHLAKKGQVDIMNEICKGVIWNPSSS